jgi:hypothetical protein
MVVLFGSNAIPTRGCTQTGNAEEARKAAFGQTVRCVRPGDTRKLHLVGFFVALKRTTSDFVSPPNSSARLKSWS